MVFWKSHALAPTQALSQGRQMWSGRCEVPNPNPDPNLNPNPNPNSNTYPNRSCTGKRIEAMVGEVKGQDIVTRIEKTSGTKELRSKEHTSAEKTPH